MNIPEPIIDPATSIVASVSVKALTNSRDAGGVSAVDVVVVKPLLRCAVSAGTPPHVQRAEVTRAKAILLGNETRK
jgi:hypothetical protein